MFDLIIATAHQINLSLMRNGTIANALLLLLLLIHGRADHM